MKKIQLLFLGILTGCSLYAQEYKPKIISAAKPDSLTVLYYNGWEQKSPIYNGRRFLGYPSTIKGTAFWNNDQWKTGSVLYENIWYDSLLLRYDIYDDQLTALTNNGLMYTIVKEKVNAFFIGHDYFVRIINVKGQNLATGFYQHLSEGKLTLLVKRTKQINEKKDGIVLEKEFLAKDQFFIVKDNVKHLISNQSQLAKISKDNPNILQYVKRNMGLRFKDNKELFISEFVNYYNKH